MIATANRPREAYRGPVRFGDRSAAGRALAPMVAGLVAGGAPVVVLGLPRGGVPVAAEVARALGAPLDVLLVRKLGVPGHEELAFGALASGGVQVLNAEVVALVGLTRTQMEDVVRRETDELQRREQRYRDGRPPVPVGGRTVVVVDDGLATGATMRAAVRALRDRRAARIVVAVPVGSAPGCQAVEEDADALICCIRPRRFHAVGTWYENFAAVSDATVAELLAGHPPTPGDRWSRTEPAPPRHET
jgi:predicted phosphoribosyltransferase